MADNKIYLIGSKVSENEPYYLASDSANIVNGMRTFDRWQKVAIPGTDITQFALKNLKSSLYLAWDGSKIILSDQTTFAWMQFEEKREFKSTPTAYSIRPQPNQSLYLTFRDFPDADILQFEVKTINTAGDDPLNFQLWKFLQTE